MYKFFLKWKTKNYIIKCGPKSHMGAFLAVFNYEKNFYKLFTIY
jgi:hypothetical protein